MTTSQLLHHTLFAGALAFAAFLIACDRTVETKSRTVSGPSGSTVQKESTVQHSTAPSLSIRNPTPPPRDAGIRDGRSPTPRACAI
jgi:hypothetical protein